PTRYESNFAGLQARQDYRVINLWEVDVEIAFQQPILYEASLCANPQGRRGRIHNTASFASSPRFGVIESVRNCSRFFC
ncbi:MAG: hypothetical protein DSM106950_28310, partial [Stigonema ocellatum SAG 48.90 = DSM 106950]|nr:hypothetical protein [Stigonema ocellatum SAG 48.90 = DSM 106950]